MEDNLVELRVNNSYSHEAGMGPICDACSAIDFKRLLEVPARSLIPDDLLLPYPHGMSGRFLLADQGSVRILQPESTTCPLCSLLRLSSGLQFESTAQPPLNGIDHHGFGLETQSFTMGCGWSQGAADWANDCHKLVVFHRDSEHIWPIKQTQGSRGSAVCLPKEQKEIPFIPRVISDHFDVRKARSWLRSCKKEHGAWCNEDSVLVPGMRVIDCESRAIVEAQPKMIWVALSYVWGNTHSSTLLQGASKTVEDAIKVTKSLGYRYLWVDQFCIDQKDECHKQSQITKMDAIYRGADLTIIAAAGQDSNYGLPGVGNPRRIKQQVAELASCTILWTGPDPIGETRRSAWWSRGWTFQEGLLSRRRVYFTDRQSWFECANACWMEGMGGAILDNPSNEIHAPAGKLLSLFEHLAIYQKTNVDEKNEMGIGVFLTLVRLYSRRVLKFDSDSLAAFLGVANHLQNTGPQVCHVFGIPYMKSLLGTDTAENYLFYALCWLHRHRKTSQRIPQFPSWTWAGWTGAVDWMSSDITGGPSRARSKIRYIQFEEEGKLISLHKYLRAWQPNKCLVDGLKVAIRFEAQIVPSSLFATRQDNEMSFGSSKKLAQKKTSNSRTTLSDDLASTKSSIGAQGRKSASDEILQSWENCTLIVGTHTAWGRLSVPTRSPLEFIQKLAIGQWGCLLLGEFNASWPDQFLLVVQWLANGQAQRVGMVVVETHDGIFHDKDLSWRSVRLV